MKNIYLCGKFERDTSSNKKFSKAKEDVKKMHPNSHVVNPWHHLNNDNVAQCRRDLKRCNYIYMFGRYEEDPKLIESKWFKNARLTKKLIFEF